MSKLKPVTWRELIKKLKNLGFSGPFQEGKHPYMIKEDLVRISHDLIKSVCIFF